MLSIYAQTFNSVEIDSTFYHIPKGSTVKNWLVQVSSDFIFSIKVPKRVLQNPKENMQKFTPALDILPQSNPKHCLLLQFPASLHYEYTYIASLLKALPQGIRYAIELRHQSWFCEEFYTLLQQNNVALVLSDSPNTMWSTKDIQTASFAYIRFHGYTKLYDSSYPKEVLEIYAKLILEKQKQGMDIYCYFNNTMHAQAIENAQLLYSLLYKELLDL